MEIVQKGQRDIQDIIRILSLQIKENARGGYHLHKYCVVKDYKKKLLIYNLLTSEMLAIEPEEMAEFETSKYAIEHFFSFEEEMNDKKLVSLLKEEMSKGREKVSKYTIYTTTNCNARCYYCFENGSYKKNMSLETANKLLEIIDKTADPDALLELSWFGGEPTVNMKIIDYICNHYKEKNRKFFSTMVTNAYLLNQENLKKARECWNLKWVLITIDGYGEEYNAIKNYVNAVEDPFYTVMNNIEEMLNQGIVIVMTLRANGENEESLMKLIDYLAERFPERQNLMLNCQLIHLKSAGIYIPDVKNKEVKMLKSQKKILGKLYEKGLYKTGVPKNFKDFQCDSTSGKAMNIHPDGKIACCLCYMEGADIGSIYQEETDEEIWNSFKEKYDELEACRECMLYPRCIRLQRCDNAAEWCTVERRKNEEYRIILQMYNTYDDYKTRECE